MSTATIIVPETTAWALTAAVSVPIARLSQKFIVVFPDIKVDRTIFRLNRRIELTLEKVDGGWTCEEKQFSLFGFGESSMDAVCSVFEDFAVLWDEIANAPDELLTEEAHRTKLALLAFVKSVDENH